MVVFGCSDWKTNGWVCIKKWIWPVSVFRDDLFIVTKSYVFTHPFLIWKKKTFHLYRLKTEVTFHIKRLLRTLFLWLNTSNGHQSIKRLAIFNVFAHICADLFLVYCKVAQLKSLNNDFTYINFQHQNSQNEATYLL